MVSGISLQAASRSPAFLHVHLRLNFQPEMSILIKAQKTKVKYKNNFIFRLHSHCFNPVRLKCLTHYVESLSMAILFLCSFSQ